MAGSINLSRSTVVGDLFHNVITQPRGGHCPYEVAKATAVTGKEASGRLASGEGAGAPTRPCSASLRCHGRILLHLSGSACLPELTMGCSTNQKADIPALRTSVQRAVCQ